MAAVAQRYARYKQRLADLQKFYVSNGVVAKEAPVKDLYTNQFVSAR